MRLDRPLAQDKTVGDLTIRVAAGDQRRHVAFAVSQASKLLLGRPPGRERPRGWQLGCYSLQEDGPQRSVSDRVGELLDTCARGIEVVLGFRGLTQQGKYASEGGVDPPEQRARGDFHCDCARLLKG